MPPGVAGTHEERLPERRLPIPVTVLLLAAIVDAWLVASWQLSVNSFPSDLPRVFLEVVERASDFLIAAGLMGGSGRWSGRRRWFVAAAALFALHGILSAAQAGWLASLTLGTLAVTDQLLAQLPILALAIALLGLGGPLAVVFAMWDGRPGAIRIGGLRGWLIGATAVAGTLAIAAHLAFVGAFFPGQTSQLVPAITAYVEVGSTVSITLLALAALATMPRGGGVGNLLIAGGIGVGLVATGWEHWFGSQGQLQDLPSQFFDLVFTAPGAVAVAGTLVMVGGVVVGRRPLR